MTLKIAKRPRNAPAQLMPANDGHTCCSVCRGPLRDEDREHPAPPPRSTGCVTCPAASYRSEHRLEVCPGDADRDHHLARALCRARRTRSSRSGSRPPAGRSAGRRSPAPRLHRSCRATSTVRARSPGGKDRYTPATALHLLLPADHVGVVLREPPRLAGVGAERGRWRRWRGHTSPSPPAEGSGRRAEASPPSKRTSAATAPQRSSGPEPCAWRTRSSSTPPAAEQRRIDRPDVVRLAVQRDQDEEHQDAGPADHAKRAQPAIETSPATSPASPISVAGPQSSWPSRKLSGVTRSSCDRRRSSIWASTGKSSRICPTMLGLPIASARRAASQGHGVRSHARATTRAGRAAAPGRRRPR